MNDPVRIVRTYTVMVGNRSVGVFDKWKDANRWALGYVLTKHRKETKTPRRKPRRLAAA